MSNSARVDKTLFTGTHYLGKPAGDEDRIISRRMEILDLYPEFFGKTLHCIEVGCGPGTSITRLSSRFASTVGIDIYDYAAAFSIQKDKNKAHNSRFMQIDLEKENMPMQFDRLISFEVIEHFRKEQSVSAFNSILKPGGLAAITVPNKWWIFETHGARLPLLPWNRVPFFSWLPRPVHERFANARIYTMRRIRKLLNANGFMILDSCYITAPMDVLKEGKLKKILTKYIFRNNKTKVPFFSTSLFLLIRKTGEADAS